MSILSILFCVRFYLLHSDAIFSLFNMIDLLESFLINVPNTCKLFQIKSDVYALFTCSICSNRRDVMRRESAKTTGENWVAKTTMKR